MAFFGLLQDITNIYSALSRDDVTEDDFEQMKEMIVHQMQNEYLRGYVQNQEPNSWKWNCDMLRVQLIELAREYIVKYINLSPDQQATYPNAFTVMHSIEVLKFGDYQKAGQITSEIMRTWTLEHRVDTMSEEFRKKWLDEIVRICMSFRNNS